MFQSLFKLDICINLLMNTKIHKVLWTRNIFRLGYPNIKYDLYFYSSRHLVWSISDHPTVTLALDPSKECVILQKKEDIWDASCMQDRQFE